MQRSHGNFRYAGIFIFFLFFIFSLFRCDFLQRNFALPSPHPHQRFCEPGAKPWGQHMVHLNQAWLYVFKGKKSSMYVLFTSQNLYTLICSFFSSLWSVTGRSHRSELESMQKKRQHTPWSVGQEDEKTLAGSHAYDMLVNVTTNNYPSHFHCFHIIALLSCSRKFLLFPSPFQFNWWTHLRFIVATVLAG